MSSRRELREGGHQQGAVPVLWKDTASPLVPSHKSPVDSLGSGSTKQWIQLNGDEAHDCDYRFRVLSPGEAASTASTNQQQEDRSRTPKQELLQRQDSLELVSDTQSEPTYGGHHNHHPDFNSLPRLRHPVQRRPLTSLLAHLNGNHYSSAQSDGPATTEGSTYHDLRDQSAEVDEAIKFPLREDCPPSPRTVGQRPSPTVSPRSNRSHDWRAKSLPPPAMASKFQDLDLLSGTGTNAETSPSPMLQTIGTRSPSPGPSQFELLVHNPHTNITETRSERSQQSPSPQLGPLGNNQAQEPIGICLEQLSAHYQARPPPPARPPLLRIPPTIPPPPPSYTAPKSSSPPKPRTPPKPSVGTPPAFALQGGSPSFRDSPPPPYPAPRRARSCSVGTREGHERNRSASPALIRTRSAHSIRTAEKQNLKSMTSIPEKVRGSTIEDYPQSRERPSLMHATCPCCRGRAPEFHFTCGSCVTATVREQRVPVDQHAAKNEELLKDAELLSLNQHPRLNNAVINKRKRLNALKALIQREKEEIRALRRGVNGLRDRTVKRRRHIAREQNRLRNLIMIMTRQNREKRFGTGDAKLKRCRVEMLKGLTELLPIDIKSSKINGHNIPKSFSFLRNPFWPSRLTFSRPKIVRDFGQPLGFVCFYIMKLSEFYGAVRTSSIDYLGPQSTISLGTKRYPLYAGESGNASADFFKGVDLLDEHLRELAKKASVPDHRLRPGQILANLDAILKFLGET